MEVDKEELTLEISKDGSIEAKKAFDIYPWKGIIGQYPLEEKENHVKCLSKPQQASANSTSYSFLNTKSMHVLWIESII